MVFGKLIDGAASFAKRIVEYHGETVEHPSDEILVDLGFLPVVFAMQPEAPEDFTYEETWTEENGELVQGWELVPADDDISDSEVIEILLGGAV